MHAALDYELEHFNPRSREGSDFQLRTVIFHQASFQSTLPRGERPCTGSDDHGADRFQSTLPRGERQSGERKPPSYVLFQSTLPRGERLRCSPVVSRIRLFDPNISNEDGDYKEYRVPVISIHAPARGATPAARRQAGRMSISIHAPARGATQHLVGQGSEQVISIHAPARGATFTPPAFLSASSTISIHAPARGATQTVSAESVHVAISIHAPARGATAFLAQVFQITGIISIHAPARGATRQQLSPYPSAQFQSTLPRGERLVPCGIVIKGTRFQSTLPRGERPRPGHTADTAHQISIHAPARGATIHSSTKHSPRGNFNPRSREGSDPVDSSACVIVCDFNPRSREGSDNGKIKSW